MSVGNNTIISIVPDLKGGMGHMYGYHKAVGAAAQVNGWRHFVATAPDPILSSLPEGWIACLDVGDLELSVKAQIRKENVFSVIKQIYLFASSIIRFVRGVCSEHGGQVTIFIERFLVLQLVSVLLAVIGLNRKRLNCWVLFRCEPLFFGMSGPVYKFSTSCLRLLLGNDRFKILVDSEPLRQSLTTYFKQPVHVVPIPHTHSAEKIVIVKGSNEIVLWWPGSPRIDKGWDVIKRIATATDKAIPLAIRTKLVVSDAAGIHQSRQDLTIQLVRNVLPEEDYKRQLFCSDIILLPYNANYYRASTSGIFTEAIAAGTIPVVTDGTLMAYELNRFNLGELVIDWNQGNLINHIVALASDCEVRRKINIMRDNYLAFHSVKSFAQTLNRVINNV